MLTLLKLIVWILLAISSAHIADLKGRNKYFWGTLGFFIGVWSLVILALLPDKQFRRRR